MSTFLINHALSHVWCAPRMDLQSRLKPARICPKDGVWNKTKIMWSTYRLPTQKERYYVYQVGQLHPSFMGLLDKTGSWISFADACAATNLMVDIYSIEGIQLPRMQSYYMVTNDNNVVIAVKDQRAKIAFDLRSEDLYIRFYNNAFYNAQRDNPAQAIISIAGGAPRNNAEIVALQMQYEAYLKQPGATWAYINGFKVDSISLLTVKVDDIVEMVYDASVLRTVSFTVGDLRTFDSTLDNKRKYLLHYAGAASNDIDYHDDIDFYLVLPDSAGRHRGVYMHRNAEDLVRMVTHRDYAMSVQGLLAFAQYRSEWIDVNKLQVIAIIRKGGWNRTLIPENNRINELYKLSDSDVRDAMLGVNSVVQNWRADTLEASAYAAIMRAKSMILDQSVVEDAYGYNAVSVLLGMTPSKIFINSLQKEVKVPSGLQKNSTAYEYDSTGKLIGWYPHLSGDTYVCRNVETDLVEQLVGLADSRIDETYDQPTQVIDLTLEYRMYVCDIVDGAATNKWRDVTGNGGMYIIDGTVLRWAVDNTKFSTMVRSNGMILAYSFSQMVTNGTLDFSLVERVLRNNIIANQVMQVPLGVLEVFLNGRKLIQGLDYYITFPRVVIVNKEYLISADRTAQNIAIRFTGFCDANFNMEPPIDFGFVQHGVLSDNNRYDLRDDRVQHIAVGGYLYDKSELLFAENGLSVSPVDSKNGQPYIVQDIFVPFKGITLQKTLDMRAKSRVIDKAVSDYMTIKLPEQTTTLPSAIVDKYTVYSPFLSRLISDLNAGYLTDSRMKQHYSTDLVKELCAPYLWLLAFEPSSDALQADPRYVDVVPHPWTVVVDINIYNYKFVKMVVDYYLGGRVNLSTYLRISGV